MTNNAIVQSYLFFDGKCEEAVEFYKKALGAKVEMLLRYSESPEPLAPGCGPSDLNKVMHTSFRIGGTHLMASDGLATGKPNFQGFALSLTYPTEAGADTAFAALAEGGKVEMPMTKTFFAPRFGTVVDRFGVHWMVTARPVAEGAFVISRLLDAPRETVWKAWTDREQFIQWFGPKGVTMPIAKLDFRVGGGCHSCMLTPDGREMWGKFNYKEITAPERLVYSQHFSDANGGVTRHPMSATWPLQMLTTVTFQEQKGKTLLTMEWVPLNPTEDEKRTFDSAHEQMKMGWGGTFEQLTDFLARTK